MFYKFPFVGLTFQTTDATKGQQFCLDDIKVEGMDPAVEYLYSLNPNTGARDASTSITYVSYENAQRIWNEGGYYTEDQMREYSGWWTSPIPPWPDPEYRGDAQQLTGVTFPCGTSFMASFSATHEVKFVCSGQVQKAVPVTFKNMIYPLLCNPLPRDVQFKEIAANIDPGAEYIYKLNRSSGAKDASTSITYVSYENAQRIWNEGGYYTEDQMREYSGWWTSPIPPWPDPEYRGDAQQVNNDYWKSGEGWMGNFTDTSEVVISFPDAIPAATAE